MTVDPQPLLSQLTPQLRHNCLVADAQAAGHFSMCGLLLRLRNLYKWERGLDPWREEEPSVMLAWVGRREEMWLECEDQEPAALTLNGQEFDPFDTEGLEEHLAPAGLVYGAGLAGGLLPAFFLGRVTRRYERYGLEVLEVGEEQSRDILFLPGLSQGGMVYLRREPFGFLLWDKLMEPRPSAARFVRFGLAGYGLDPEKVLTRPDWEAFNLILERELEAVLWHEAGEAGPGAAARGLLEKALRLVPGSDLEHFVRGVKDVLADTGTGGRLDRIIKEGAAGTLGLYPAWLAGYPRMLFPEVDAAVMQFMADSDWSAVEEARLLGLARATQAVERLEDIMAGDDPENILARARAEVIGPLTGHRPSLANQD